MALYFLLALVLGLVLKKVGTYLALKLFLVWTAGQNRPRLDYATRVGMSVCSTYTGLLQTRQIRCQITEAHLLRYFTSMPPLLEPVGATVNWF